ncbi:hypothetical protein [Dyadobacter pollutisoli]|jgi:hypothetical protein|uniref:Uncharacterized protein n=1 Tax=Dyadobacter pollutisoli TaxID=2910158 RepID=A0A9E8NES0_9BACT|nr:hypothetical protein [Dyadobacter pollutisoli]WAC13948.1 hypothetical protein ON006_08285 [Dyadobacter pollutisoli]
MIWNVFKGLALGFLLFIFGSILWHLFETSHMKTVWVNSCDGAAGQSLKALSKLVKNSWFERKHNDVQVISDGQCMFYKFYQKPGALYFGQDMASGHRVGVAMTTTELHQFADTVSSHTSFQKMLDYLAARAKTHPAPAHKF